MSDGGDRGWIHSKPFDLALFIASPIAGLIIIATAGRPFGALLNGVALYLVAIPHYLSSFTFYLGDDNRRYYRTRRAAFFLGPVLIVVIYGAVLTAGYVRIIQSTMFVWNIYHVALQSAGILGVYRRLNGGPPTDRRVSHLAILGCNATMAFWFIERFEPLHTLLVAIHPAVPTMIPMITLPTALVAFGVLVRRFIRRRHAPPPEIMFLGTSLALFHPYLWVENSDLATFAMLMGHFFQYLAIVWLLNRRKYRNPSGTQRQRILVRISRRTPALLTAIGVVGFTFYGFNEITSRLGASGVYLVAWNLMTLLHFYTDGLVWTFRRPFVRQTVGPFVAPESHIVR